MRDHEYQSGHKTTTDKQLKVLRALSVSGAEGVTPREMAKIEARGDVSGVNGWGSPFTVLRQEGHVIALAERRERHHVYVLPQYQLGRDTWPGYRHRGHCKTCTCNEEEIDG